MILECSVKQKQMAPNNFFANNLYQLNAVSSLYHFYYVTLTSIPKQCLCSFRVEGASYFVGWLC